MKAIQHKHRWTYYGGMASCACGYELLPDGTTRYNKRARSHNRRYTPSAQAREKKAS